MKLKIALLVLLCFSVGMAQQKDKKQSADKGKWEELKEYPKPISPIQPEYPQLAKLAGIEGKVYVEALISETGNVVEIKSLKSDHETLMIDAIEAVRRTKFSPGISKDGKKVKAWVVIPIVFKLEGDKKELKDITPIDNSKADNEVELEPDINTFQEVEKLPEMIEADKPVYPEEAKRNKITGKTFVKVLIDKNGNTKKAVVIKSEHELFNQPAIDAAMKSKFTPAMQGGNPIAVWIVLPYRFTLEGEKNNDDVRFSVKELNSDKEAKKFFKANSNMKSAVETLGNKKAKYEIENVKTSVIFGDESALIKIKMKQGEWYVFAARKGNKIYDFQSDQLEKLLKYVTDYKSKEKQYNDFITISINSDDPTYPKEAIEKELRGSVLVKVYFEKDKLEKVETYVSNNPILDKAAEEIVCKNFLPIYDGIIKGDRMEGLKTLVKQSEKDPSSRVSSISYPDGFTLVTGQIVRVSFILNKTPKD
ncbi:MAG: hypothetical protein A2499_02225 [Stygiobacter sp. RIFOXYC12_FULL_38_8]|nr:MAG: hypothetical protein A2X62_14700 [Stygiobacter sp. GWC2_38_9]OGU84677.1 MAG: hypothetical protein A2279_10305 [Stygiobacter sp. RIFOXYA12_FULL_38_9]OGV06993.1 MAG: hypothetical protein A2299_17475 [Stygiobacter sp. RIFOXYB2_FULL_37_11]OGV12983.1 MAG: hypothetical protein A2237_02885 [Stygiobacter sp. RIFOXYA2_FULL_38_8]OGV14430.1 MAG: hypothetical protein A2440_08290 [Stygiobacter sp. RIFOXYC2_FULL_38_25]OGV29867.1 MAG: hypothetical protein A2499_02225 [Stygiobacter sp. RIFOXYC12_FULL_